MRALGRFHDEHVVGRRFEHPAYGPYIAILAANPAADEIPPVVLVSVCRRQHVCRDGDLGASQAGGGIAVDAPVYAGNETALMWSNGGIDRVAS